MFNRLVGKSGRQSFLLAQTEPIRRCEKFIGRQKELALCRAAWCVERNGATLRTTKDAKPLHFRLHGAPGVGKNEIVYEIARCLNLPLYIVQGHEELTPEDLALLVVTDPEQSERSSMPLVLRASPLATAIYLGGLVFFDEINRVPERALAPLSSVLDGRQQIYSATTGIWIGPNNDEAAAQFRFCCALNPEAADAGQQLPEYIQQRTLPVIHIDAPPFEDLISILRSNLECSDETIAAFRKEAEARQNQTLSLRQAMVVMAFALNYMSTSDAGVEEAVSTSFQLTMS
jgi:MoxR-like ATPase